MNSSTAGLNSMFKTLAPLQKENNHLKTKQSARKSQKAKLKKLRSHLLEAASLCGVDVKRHTPNSIQHRFGTINIELNKALSKLNSFEKEYASKLFRNLK